MQAVSRSAVAPPEVHPRGLDLRSLGERVPSLAMRAPHGGRVPSNPAPLSWSSWSEGRAKERSPEAMLPIASGRAKRAGSPRRGEASRNSDPTGRQQPLAEGAASSLCCEAPLRSPVPHHPPSYVPYSGASA